jgi:hypothetical protein
VADVDSEPLVRAIAAAEEPHTVAAPAPTDVTTALVVYYRFAFAVAEPSKVQACPAG